MDAEWETTKQNGLISDIELMTRAELVSGGYTQEGAEQMMKTFNARLELEATIGHILSKRPSSMLPAQ